MLRKRCKENKTSIERIESVLLWQVQNQATLLKQIDRKYDKMLKIVTRMFGNQFSPEVVALNTPSANDKKYTGETQSKKSPRSTSLFKNLQFNSSLSIMAHGFGKSP